MKITADLADYLSKATTALASGALSLNECATHCTECDEQADEIVLDDEERGYGCHLIAQAPTGDYVVLVGCEGYWIVNPNLLGMIRPEWDDWRQYV